MNKDERTAINPTRMQDYPQWYQEVIKAADLAENSIVRGCMIIKPWGYALWEQIKDILDKKIKATGHENFYFPMFVPLSFMAKEAEHVEGFAKECAVVTHHRLESDAKKGLVLAGQLEEPLVVRPTSEVIIGEAFSRWINSYRDLPLLGNQWANVVRWEMRPRLFLRTSEFLWQEGHTAHATKNEAIVEAEKMLGVYRQLAEDWLAMPVIPGKKTEHEKFPGADITYCIEAMMQDKKALQAGTSHYLGQNFSKAFDIKFLSNTNQEEYAWTTSWGVSTRLIGGLIMTHSDDNGLVLPPKIAPIQVVIIPLLHQAKQETQSSLLTYCKTLKANIEAQQYDGRAIRAKLDLQEKRAGEKAWSWIKKGVPIRLEIGPKELENSAVFMGRRDKTPKDKQSMDHNRFVEKLPIILAEIQQNLFNRAHCFLQENTYQAKNKTDFYQYFHPQSNQNGFVLAHWIGDQATEDTLKEQLKVTPRCIPLATEHQTGRCIFTGTDNAPLTLFAQAY